MNILIIYGSLNEKSINKALAMNAQKLAPEGMTIEILGIEGFPLYSDTIEKAGFPPIATQYKEKIKGADGIIIATPEYNRSMPGSLKNVIDWTSRGELPWRGKPVGVIGASDGLRGASFAQYDVKRILTYFGAYVMGQPEFYFHEADTKIDETGTISDEKTIQVLAKYLVAFKSHVELLMK
jgi:chromate reductase, NAD(P)H dehydrogenase (quinone)